MKKLFTLLVLIATIAINAQAPQGFNYQATVRNSSGQLLLNQIVLVKFNILQNAATGTTVYSETQTANTDDLGHIALVVGQGTATTGTFSTINWGSSSYYLGIEFNTGTGYVAMGTTQLLSVPYALYANSAGNSQVATPSLEAVLAVSNSANNTKITNLQNPTNVQDAATKSYVDSQLQTQVAQLQAQIKALQNDIVAYSYLALGDSYTIGESVCETCRFPEQLKSGLQSAFPKDTFTLEVIATTGWTTTNLLNAIDAKNLKPNYDLVTLLIGVNNQYQGKPFSLYEQEFPELVNKAISLAKGDKTNVIVVSIPDYAYTRFGNGNTSISKQIDTYNTFAKVYCIENNIAFVNITDITRLGLIETNLVANDGLHPSAVAYSKFVERILPIAKTVLSQ